MSVASDPASRAKAVVPDDNIIVGANALYVGTTGDLSVVVKNGDAATLFKAVPVGWFPVNAYQVKATGTTATDIVALF